MYRVLITCSAQSTPTIRTESNSRDCKHFRLENRGMLAQRETEFHPWTHAPDTGPSTLKCPGSICEPDEPMGNVGHASETQT
ncbi:hypothetical protein NQ315_014505 [Exocentrus adspersus]|uniref:Uncharacterized protein n=1 Tax=Exocentrus adspersus TaxID=1586481 RepID=A0AAV8V624_9CUCU|nr:hypothetical protein NQ315_014505 [Exocentrus adspersus]